MSQRLARLTLLPGGTAALVTFLTIAHARTTAVPYDPFGTSRFPWTVAFVVLFLTALYGLGLPDLPESRSHALLSASFAAVVAVTGISLAQLSLGSALLPRVVVAGSALTVVPWAILCWMAHSDVNAHTAVRIFVVGHPDEVGALKADLMRENEKEAEIVGWESAAELAERAMDLRSLVVESGAQLLVLNVQSQADEEVVRQAAELHQMGIRIRTLSLFSEEFLGKIPLGEMERMSLLFDIGEVHRMRYVRAKRVVDVLSALIGVVPLLVILPIVLLANAIGNRGPLFYRQVRIGKDGKPFEILKLRSMLPNDGPTRWTAVDDARVTPVGNLMRRSHIDELPQLLNIVRGDLSIVGPRPEQVVYVEELRNKLPYYDVRHLVRPGLTGWAQVKYGYAGDENDAREKLQYDLYYLRRQSLALDVRILVRTLRTVLLGNGR